MAVKSVILPETSVFITIFVNHSAGSVFDFGAVDFRGFAGIFVASFVGEFRVEDYVIVEPIGANVLAVEVCHPAVAMTLIVLPFTLVDLIVGIDHFSVRFQSIDDFSGKRVFVDIKHDAFIIACFSFTLNIDRQCVIKHFILVEELKCLRIFLYKIEKFVRCESFFGIDFIKFIMILNVNSPCKPTKLGLFSLINPFAGENILPLTRFAKMQVFTLSFKIFTPLYARIVLLM